MNSVESFQRMYTRAITHDPTVVIAIVKSDNTNIVVYRAELSEDKESFTETSPHGYWQTWELAKDDIPVHDSISTLESKLAFGIKIIDRSPTKITFTLKGYPTLPVTLQITEGQIQRTLLFGGSEYQFSGIYVHIDGNPTKPKGISLMVQIPEMDESPLFPIYIDRNTKLE